MRHWKLLTLGAILFIVLFTFSAQAQAGEYHEPFDDPALPGWERSPGTAVNDGILRVEPGNFAALPGGWGEMETHVIMKLEGEGEVFFTFRMGDGSSYRLVFGTNYLILFREQDGASTILHSIEPLPAPMGEWFHLTVLNTAENQLILINDEAIFETFEIETLPPGGISFEAHGEMNLTLEELIIIPLEEIAPPEEESPAEEPSPQAEEAPPPAEINFDGNLTWIRTGGPLGGLGYDVRMHPENPDIMYVTDALAGVFKSIDGGKNWFPINNGITVRTGTSQDSIPIFCLTIDPHDPETIWVGTQDKRGIFKSEDGGASWVMKVNGIVETNGITFRGITIDPTNQQILYAAAELSSWIKPGGESTGREFDKTTGVVYKSTNGGENWQAIWRGNNLARYILIDPRDSNVLYVSTGIFDREAANSDAASNTPGGEGVIKSTDGGQTWHQMNNGLLNLYIGTLIMHPENPDILLAGAANNAYREGGGVYLTSDGGQNWTRVLEHEAHSVEFSTSNSNIAYAGNTWLIFRSEDGGHNWEMTLPGEGGWGAPGVEAGFPIDFQIDPRNPDRIFANNYGGGNFLSEDGGQSWSDASTGYTGAMVRVLATSPIEPGVVYAGARSGIFVSTNGGEMWTGLIYPQSHGLDWNTVAIDPQDPKHILGTSNWGNFIAESNDGGLSWAVSNFPELTMQGGRALVFAPSDPKIAYAGFGGFFSAGSFDNQIPASGVYTTRDGGSTWSAANDSSTATANVADLAVHPTDPQMVLMASPNTGLFKTADGGASWNKVSSLVGNLQPLSVDINPSNPNLILMGSDRGGVYRSVDSGQTWARISAGIPAEATISTVLFHPNDPNIAFCADLFSGVYRSSDQGQTWQIMNNGLENRAVNTLAISADGWHIYAGTEGGGAFRLDFSGNPPEAGNPIMVEKPVEVGSSSDQPDGDKPQSPPPGVSEESGEPADENEFEPPKLSNILIIVGVLVLLAAIIIILIFKRRPA